jgi:hypothetical protein
MFRVLDWGISVCSRPEWEASPGPGVCASLPGISRFDGLAATNARRLIGGAHPGTRETLLSRDQ